VVDRAELRAAREAWRALPRTRRRALEVRGASPRDRGEAEAVVHRGRYLRGWAGALEWFVAGAIGVGLAIALQYGLGGPLPWDPAQVVIFVLGFGIVGAALRRWRGGQLIARGHAALAVDPAADDRTGPGRGEGTGGPGEEFGTSGPGG
jgi:hypothetical protein